MGVPFGFGQGLFEVPMRYLSNYHKYTPVTLGMVVQTRNPTTQEAEAGGCQEFQSDLSYSVRHY